MINQNRLVSLTRKLVKIPSENPPGNEKEVAMLVKREMKHAGMKTRNYEFEKGRPNVVGVLKGKRQGKKLLLAPHLDTVPAGKGWKTHPFSAKIARGKLYGRGATDCKGNVAVCLEAARSLAEDRTQLEGDLIIAATVDEEKGSKKGIIPLIKKGILKPTFALITDGENFDVVVAQKGLVHFRIRFFGKKAHGATPEKGENAIEKAAEVITNLKKHTFRYRKHKLLTGPTINTGTIKGGDKVNIVADWCEVEVDLRYPPTKSKQEIMKEVKRIIEKTTKKYKIIIDDAQKPYESREKNAVKKLIEILEKNNKKREPKGQSGATTITFFQDKKIPAIAVAFGNKDVSHRTDEYVKINDLVKGAHVLEEFIKSYLGVAGKNKGR